MKIKYKYFERYLLLLNLYSTTCKLQEKLRNSNDIVNSKESKKVKHSDKNIRSKEILDRNEYISNAIDINAEPCSTQVKDMRFNFGLITKRKII